MARLRFRINVFLYSSLPGPTTFR